MPLWLFSLVMSTVNLLFYNIPFFGFAASHSGSSLLGNIWLILSLVVVMLVLNMLVCYLLLFLFRYVGRVLIAVSHILSSACLYFILVYNTMMDDGMISNVLNTQSSEALPFITLPLILTVAFLGVLPAVYVLWQKIDYGSPKRLGIVSAAAVATLALYVGLNFNRILWFGEYDTELGGLLMPWSYTVNTCRVLSAKHKANQKEILLPEGKITDGQKTAVVLVIGESARRQNFSLYGYGRQTNPRLSAMPDVHALNARSCATYTTAGVKAMLEYKQQKTLYEILPNYLYRAGADVVWRTSNWGEPPVHIDEYEKHTVLRKRYADLPDRDYDGVLFCGLKERILGSSKPKVFIVLHTGTSHGPSYNLHYPERFEQFKPVAESVEEGRNDQVKLFNAYDNSVLYTDYLLANLIDTLRTLTDWNTAVMFVSDHGESLGENGIYMHGVPMSIAPREQFEIPFLVWTSPRFRRLKVQTGEIEQHAVFHSVLNLLSVQSEIYDPEKDLFVKE